MSIRRTPAHLPFTQIRVGTTRSFQTVLSPATIRQFIRLTGDQNPLHTDARYAARTKFRRPVVHGMLAASFFSTLVGMYLPGRSALYMSQTLRFKRPLYAGDLIRVAGTVVKKNNRLRLLTLETRIERARTVCIEGEAQVLYRP